MKKDFSKIENPALAFLTTAQDTQAEEPATTKANNNPEWVEVPETFLDGSFTPVKRETKNSRFNILTTERKGQYIRYIAYKNQQSINEVINEAIDLVITKYMAK